MENLGFYAKCRSTDNLYCFTWTKGNDFLIKSESDGWVRRDVRNFEILNVGFFTADSN